MSQFWCADIETLGVCMCTCVGGLCVFTVEARKMILCPICFLVQETFGILGKKYKADLKKLLQVDPVFVVYIAALEAALPVVLSVPVTAAF